MHPDFVAAHNALGSALLNLGQNNRARATSLHSRSRSITTCPVPI